jgi:hypothetical protein
MPDASQLSGPAMRQRCAPSLEEGFLSSSPRWKLRFPIQCTKLLEMKDPIEDTERVEYLSHEKFFCMHIGKAST